IFENEIEEHNAKYTAYLYHLSLCKFCHQLEVLLQSVISEKSIHAVIIVKLPDKFETYPRCWTLKTSIMFLNRRIGQTKITEVVLSLRILVYRPPQNSGKNFRITL
ncbi:hypothetical protein L9F63_012739, partial [Diploptera punctata]